MLHSVRSPLGGGWGPVASPVFKTVWASVLPAPVGSTPMRPRHENMRPKEEIQKCGPERLMIPANSWHQLALALLLSTFLLMGANASGLGMGGGIALAVIVTIVLLIVGRRS